MFLIRIAAAPLALLAAGAARAACETDAPAEALGPDAAQALYDCLSEDMHAGYVGGDKKWIDPAVVTAYRDWRLASTAPAAPGPHGGRFLLTWVNDVGWEEYVDWDAEAMPAGTLIAKESFDLGEDGVARPGPLFFMEKAAEGVSPETAGWLYYAVTPGGAPMAVDVISACDACHAGFSATDRLGYPAEAVRVGR